MRGARSMRCGSVVHHSPGTLGGLHIEVRLGEVWLDEGGLPMALPAAQQMNVAATTVAFLVWPAMLRETIDRASVWADQKDSVI